MQCTGIQVYLLEPPSLLDLQGRCACETIVKAVVNQLNVNNVGNTRCCMGKAILVELTEGQTMLHFDDLSYRYAHWLSFLSLEKIQLFFLSTTMVSIVPSSGQLIK